MNIEEKLIPSTKMTPLVTAIISTIFWVVLFPILLFGAIICLTMSSAPIIPWIGIIVYISVFLLSLTSPIAILCIWLCFFYKKTSQTYLCNVIPIITILVLSVILPFLIVSGVLLKN